MMDKKTGKALSYDELVSYLRKSLAEELDVPVDGIDLEVSFLEIGLDSLTGVTWTRKLNTRFGLSLSATTVYSHPNVDALATYILGRGAPAPSPAPVPVQRKHDQGDDVAAVLRSSLAKQLEVSEDALDDATPFLELGLDSITGVTWTREINTHFRIALSVTTVYSHPTLRALAECIRRDHGAVGGGEAESRDVAPDAAASESRATDIAIVGMSGAFPAAENLEAFWQNIVDKKDCISEVPASRWSVEQFYEPKPGKPGKSYSKWMGVLERAAEFDPLFFNISPGEAEAMDPQQRLLLQESWRCLEDAGYDPDAISGRPYGVFIGCSVNGYGGWIDETELTAHQNLGNNSAILASRISYFLNLRGPCLSIDTSCSSSLVAIASACDSLCSGDSEAALAGGVWVIPGPGVHVAMSQLNALSPDGRCFAFDQRANGFVPAEGVGVVLLKRLADAVRDGDRIHAVIRGWGVNQDGRSNGITAPNAEAQADLQMRVYRKFDIDPADIQLVEAHGTGTALGDPVEIDGLLESFRAFTGEEGYCALGSVKSNIGHTACAAGVASALKAIFALKYGILPPSIQYEQQNEHIALEGTPFYVNTEARPWKARGRGRCAAVSSFGYSGTNAHIVLAEAPQAAPRGPSREAGTSEHLVVLSARTAEQLKRQVLQLVEYAKGRPEMNLRDVSYTLLRGRKHFRHRLAAVVRGVPEWTRALETWLDAGNAAGVRTGERKPAAGNGNGYADYRDLASVAERYVLGHAIAYEALFDDGPASIVSLPTYPFARDAYWLGAQRAPRIAPRAAREGHHPWLHGAETAFALRFNGDEFFLRDHRVQGTPLLPGVAYLELARAALLRVHGLGGGVPVIENVVWLRPARHEGGALELEVRVVRSSEDAYRYEVVRIDAAGERALLHQGTARFVAAASDANGAGETSLGLEALRAQCGPSSWTPEAFYRAYARQGLDYGPTHRSVAEVRVGRDDRGRPQALIALRCAGGLPDAGQFGLHPSILDGALQASLALEDEQDTAGVARLPFALRSLTIHRDTPDVAYAWIRHAEDGERKPAAHDLDITLCDEKGRICVELRGLSSRAPAQRPQADLVWMEPAWEAAALAVREARSYPGRHRTLLVGNIDGETQNRLREALSNAVDLRVLRLEGASLDRDYSTLTKSVFDDVNEIADVPSLLQVIVLEDGPERRGLLGISALLRTASLEHPRLRTQCIVCRDAMGPGALAELISSNAHNPDEGDIRYEGRQRFVRRITERTMPDDAGTFELRRKGGVHLVTGGLGGLGRIFAGEIVANIDAGTVVLLGRSELDAGSRSWLRGLEKANVTLDYRRLDVADANAVAMAIADIVDRYGPITGILHAAGVVHDGYMAKKSDSDVARVLAPKVSGLVHLDRATKDQPLDFFVCFSSNAGLLGNAGQSDYAAANGFMAAHADGVNQRYAEGKRRAGMRTIHWPLWASGGMQVHDAVLTQLRHLGLVPLPTASGRHAFHRIMAAAAATEAMIFFGQRAQILETVAAATKTPAPPEVPSPAQVEHSLQSLQQTLIERVSAQLKVRGDDIDLNNELSEYGFDSISLTEFANGLNERYGLAMPPTIFFEHTTLGSLADYLLNQYGHLFTAQPADTTTVDIPSADLTADLPAELPAALPAASSPVAAEPIAIIGMSGCFPQAPDLDAFWENLYTGKDCIGEIPTSRWDWRRMQDDAKTAHVRWGGFVDAVDEFDPLFFGISPREAVAMDPQQRLLMTHVWRALEDAGQAPSSLAGTDTAVLIGTAPSGYAHLVLHQGQAEDGYAATGISGSVGPNRVSYLLDVHGASEPVETACSSSLVALHRGVELLRQGKAGLAIVGGVNAMVSPELHVSYSRAGMLSEDGRCKTFSDAANGYVRGEGAAVLVLKTLQAAERDGDPIHGLILASAENHGGRAQSLTAPNPKAQAELLKATYRQSGIDARTVTYIEAHGTGTELGDPVEINGLKSAFASLYEEVAESVQGARCGLGSVKSNVGHLELAAGVAGVVKVLLQMKHGMLVESLHCKRINPYIDLAGSPFYVVQERRTWERLVAKDGRTIPRRAGVSSFGFGGVNSHVVLEEYRREPVQHPAANPANPALIVLSAKTASQLAERGTDLLRHIEQRSMSDADLPSMAYTLQIGRDAMEERAAIRVTSLASLKEKLAALVGREPHWAGWHRGSVQKGARGAIPADVDGALDRGHYDGILERWVQGATFDWERLHAHGPRPRRLNLPSYPFGKERYWATRDRGPRPDAVFERRFEGDAFFLTDHQVRGQKVLPAAVHVELAREGIARAFDAPSSRVHLADVVWLRPALCTAASLSLRIAVRAISDAECSFAIEGDDEHGHAIVYSQGRGAVRDEAPAPAVDLAHLRSRTVEAVWAAADVYEAYARSHVNYGPAHRSIIELHVLASQDEAHVLAELQIAPPVEEAGKAYDLHPSLLDGALQATIGLALRSSQRGESSGPPALPFAVDAFRAPASIPARAFAWIRPSAGTRDKLDICICDPSGRVCVEWIGLVSRPLRDAPRNAPERPVVRQVTNGAFDERALRYFKQRLATALQLGVHKIDVDTPMEHYGMDSMMAMDLTRYLEKVFGPLSKTLFFEVQTVRALSEHFVAHHRKALDALLGEASPAPAAPKPVSHHVPRARTEGPRTDVAIVGMSGRYPMAANLDEYWDNLKAGRDCIREIPESRWDHRRYFDEDKQAIGKSYCKWGGFIDGVDTFDPLFFNISPREAEYLDPQERLFLQCAYETLEDAGYTGAALASSSRVGVFVGVMYEEYQLYGAQLQAAGRNIALSGNPSSIANRVSYFFDFRGPSMAIDTMCSSSLTAIHLACEAIRSGECDAAIAGGVNVTIHPNKYLMLSQGRFASSVGRCESFGAGGDGYVPGEGVGAVLLKPLERAVADGDSIYGIVKGTALNHGGKTNGFSVPNPLAQGEVIARAFTRAGIEPRAVSYIEAHGTGTSLGDPIEISGLVKAFQAPGAEVLAQSCAIGSAKSNIGHAESAAGIAGLTKVLLQMKHAQLVPSLHSKTLNPYIDFASTPFAVQQSLETWARPVRASGERTITYPRIAGISSFGAGGSNAHLVVQEYEAETASSPSHPHGTSIIVLSAKSEAQLVERARRLLARVSLLEQSDLPNVAYTLQVGREAMEERLAFTVATLEALVSQLRAFVSAPNEPNGWSRGSVRAGGGAWSEFAGDEELQDTVRKWLERGKYEKLLDLWVQGLPVNWESMHPEGARPRRISLPAYPFAKERCWVDAALPLPESQGAARLHPLVHQNESTALATAFSARFDGSEFFLRDHRVQGQAILPGVAYLEMAREAIARAFGVEGSSAVRLYDVTWLRPAVFSEPAMALRIELDGSSASDIAFRIAVAGDGARGETVCCQGRAQWVEARAPEAMNLDSWESEGVAERFTDEHVYAAFAQKGLHYGPAHRAIRELAMGTDGEGRPRALARLELPAEVAATFASYMLHPSVMDAALQASIGLALGPKGSEEAAIPFSLDEVRIFAPTPAKAYAWVTPSVAAAVQTPKIDIGIGDERGRICVEMRGLAMRVVGARKGDAAPESDIVRMQPVWDAHDGAPAQPPAFAEHRIVFVGSFDGAAQEAIRAAWPSSVGLAFVDVGTDALDRAYRTATTQVFSTAREMLERRPTEAVMLQVILTGEPSEEARLACFSGVSGLLKTARLENPKLLAQCIQSLDGARPEIVARRALADASRTDEHDIRYFEGKRHVRRLRELPSLTGRNAVAPWRNGGVYLISGGTGGLGLALVGAIGAAAPRAKIILIGRSPLSEAQRHALEASRASGQTIEFHRVDVTDATSVRALIEQIARSHGPLTGIVHGAGVLRDNFILRKSTDELREVLAPKVDGLVALDEASREQPLEFLLCLSSMSGAFGNAGQSDYAAANGFMDAYAHYRNGLVSRGQRKGKTLSVNWPLWDAGGMQGNQATKEFLRQAGLTLLSTAAGLQTLNGLLALDERTDAPEQVLVLSGQRSAILKRLKDAMIVNTVTNTEPERALLDETVRYFRRHVSSALKLDAARLDPETPLEKYGLDSVVAMALIGQFEKTFGSLPKTLFFEVQTVRALSDYFVTHHRDPLQSMFGRTPPPVLARSAAPEPDMPRPVNVAPPPAAEAIAIVGMTGRYPLARTLEQFADNLMAGRDCIGEVPAERWDHAAFFDEHRDVPGKTYCKWGGFIEGVDQFDPLFFNLSPREAEGMDPQQRLFLESVWELLESSGLTQEAIEQRYDRRVGVYVGSMYQMYRADDADAPRRALASATSYNMIANRVSYFFGLEGPSLAVDTMCSSSSMAIHLACMDLLREESLLAIAGGVNLTIHPDKYIALSQSGLLASRPTSRSFTEGDGYLPSEGVGAVLLKPLRAAQRDGDAILAVIRASASLHGGRSNGFMIPSFKTQVNVIEQCLRRASVPHGSIGYIEAAANGAALSDAVEVRALAKVFERAERPIPIGSVKSNLGHPEAASGIAQLTKIVLQMQRETIAPLVGSAGTDRHLSLEKTPLRPCREAMDWKASDAIGPRRALLNSVGAGGTYVAMVVEAYPAPQARTEIAAGPQLILLSAKGEERLRAMAGGLAAFLRRHPAVALADVAHTLQIGREPMPQRLATVVASREELIARLEHHAAKDQAVSDVHLGNAESDDPQWASILSGPRGAEFVAALARDGDLERLAALWVKGAKIAWRSVFSSAPRTLIPLPTYPFERGRYWMGRAPVAPDPVPPPPPVTRSLGQGAEAYLANFFSMALGIPAHEIPRDKDLQTVGVDSILWSRLQRDIERELGVKLATRDIWESGTLAHLAAKLTGSPMKHPLSQGQKGLWLLHTLNPSSNVYNVPIAFRVHHALDVALFEEAFAHVLARHAQLSSVVQEEEGTPHLVARTSAARALHHEDARGLSPADLSKALKHEAKRPFDLGEGPLARARLYSVGANENVVLLVFHHIVFDGASSPIFLRDLLSTYDSLRRGGAHAKLPTAGNYGDFVHWEERLLASPDARAHRDHWLGTLRGPLPALKLDIEHDVPPERGVSGASHRETLAGEVAAEVRRFCASQKIKPAVFFLGVYQLLLQRYTGVNDLVIGIPSMGRPGPEFSDSVGYFVNMIPLRQSIDGAKRFVEHLRESSAALADALDHAAYPFPCIVRDLEASQELPGGSSAPVFQVSYAFQNKSMMRAAPDASLGELANTVEFIEEIAQEGEFKLSLEVFEHEHEFVLCTKYDAHRFDASDIARFVTHYRRSMTVLVAGADQPLSRYSPLSDEERHQLLVTWNDTRRPYSDTKCLHELFESVVARNPNRTALVFRDRELTYAELDARANRLAHALRRRGVGPDTVVGICAERSLEMVVGLFGILKAGGAYMPIEPDYPAARIAYMLENSGTPVVLTQSHLPRPSVEGLSRAPELLDLDSDMEDPSPAETLTAVHSSHLAYVIYTSGSTGRPKGAMIEHRAIVNRIEWMQNEYGLDPSDVVLQKTPFTFDVSVWEFFWPMLIGARLVLAEPGGHKDSEYLISLIRHRAVTTLHFVPPMLRLIVEQKEWETCTSIRRIFCSGEALPADLPGRHYARHRAPLHNLYGPTEAAVDVSHWTCPLDRALATVPIGRPIQNIQLYVLDEYYQPKPMGCAGQLFIAGVGLARGYLNNPDLTREKFVPNPFGNEPDARMYATGDLVRWLPDGNIEFLGRIDDQVKIRGFRIELGEIETRLSEHPSVRACVAVARADGSGDKQLVAYVVAEGDVPQGALAEHLARVLPDYMIPSAFVMCDQLPITANGKIDRKALPAPNVEAYARVEHVAPRTPTEKTLVAVCAELLSFDAASIGMNDHFFALGGHSLLIPKLTASLRLRGLECSIRSVFDAASLGALAEAIDGGRRDEAHAVPENGIRPGCARITPDMLPLVALTQDEIEAVSAAVPGGASNIQDIYPLAALQEGMLFHHSRESQNDPYVLTTLLSFESRSQLDAFARALQAVIDRHDVLRTAVVTASLTQPVQVVLRRAELRVEEIHVDRYVEEDVRAALSKRAFMNLHEAPLFRLKVVENPATGAWLMGFNMHHVIDDATSLGFLFREIVSNLANEGLALPPSVPYRNFVAHVLHASRTNDAESFFRAYLGDVTEPTIACNLHDVHGDGRSVVELRRSLDARLGDSLRARAKSLQVSPASLFHTAWALVVSACSGRDDVVFGTVLSGRLTGPHGVERMFGNFINTLPLRVTLAERGVEACVRDVDRALRELVRYEQAPLATVRSCAGVSRDVPLFNTILNYRHMERADRIGAEDLERFGVHWLSGVIERSNYPISMSIDDLGDAFSVEALVDEAQDAGLLTSYFETALEALAGALASGDACRLSDLDVVPAAVRDRLLRDWNETGTSYATNRCVHELFEEQAARTPEAVALMYEGETLSYAELDARANRLAHHLRDLGVRPDDRVALCVGRGMPMLIGVLAILKAGGGYVPLDPAYPVERLRYILEDSAPRILLTDGSLPPELGTVEIPVLHLERDAGRWAHLPKDRPSAEAAGLRAEHLAYVIYTSGSTGAPKGVMVEHRQVTRLFTATDAWFHFGPNDVWTLFHSFAFDFSVWEIWGALLYGGRLVIVPQATTRSPKDYDELVCSAGVTVLNQTPSAFRQLAAIQSNRPHRVRTVIFGGEALEVASLESWRKRDINRQTQLVNMYGITETTVHVTHQVLGPADWARTDASPIGRRIPDLRIYLLDGRGRPVPLGAVGELFVGGAGVARGYLNRPELTAERFVRDPFCDERGARMYKTGDLGRYRPDGSLEYLGRNDLQVKIRGFRIELGEIEARLGAHTAVEDVRVVARDYGEQDKRLVAYVVPREERATAVRRAARLRRVDPEAAAHMYELPNGLAIFHQNKSESDFVYEEIFTNLEYLRHGVTLHDGDCVFDVGANIGLFTLFAGLRCRNISIHAFEPIPPVFESLRANVDLYGLDARVHRCGLAAAPKEEIFTFYRHNTVISSSVTTADQAHQMVKAFLRTREELARDGESASDALVDELVGARLGSEQFTCQLRTLSEIIREQAIERIDLLKVDVENAEHEVLKGIEEHDWPKIRQLVVEVHDVGGRLKAISDMLRTRGFDVHSEQDNRLLRDTPLHNLYAVRIPREPQVESPARPERWTHATALLEDLQASLRKRLPDYMIPSAYVVMDELPLTTNGKLDHRGLPAPGGALLSKGNRIAPRSASEKVIAEIWADLLKVDESTLSVTSDFFDLGGNSILVTRLVNRMTQKTGAEIPIQTVFGASTLAGLAEELDARTAAVPEAVLQNVDEILEGIGLIENMTDEELNALSL